MTRRIPAFIMAFLVLSVAANAIQSGTGQQAPATSAAPWWPTDSQLEPGNVQDGWNMRIPIRIDPQPGRQITEGTPVQYHFDLAAELANIGWPVARTSGGETLKSFTLDTDSVRLVEYGAPQWRGGVRGEIAVQVHTTWLQQDQTEIYGKIQREEFHPQRNPLVTLEWLVPRDVTNTPQFYFLYFDIEENAIKSPAGMDPMDRERLEALYWVGRGTALYGHHIGANPGQSRVLSVIGTEDDTQVDVSVSFFGEQFRAHQPPGGQMNTFHLDATEKIRYPMGVNPAHVKIEADKPVVAALHQGLFNAREPLPSLDGRYRGNQFVVPPIAMGFRITIPPDVLETDVCVTRNNPAGEAVQTRCHTNLQPFQTRDSIIWIQEDCTDMGECTPVPPPPPDDSYRIQVTRGGPVIASYVGPFRGVANHQWGGDARQVPSAQGGPVGEVLFAPRALHTPLRALSWEQPAWTRLSIESPPDLPTWVSDDLQIPVPNAPMGLETAGLGMYTVTALREGVPADEQGRLQVTAGTPGPYAQLNPFGGPHGMAFEVQGPFVLYAYYDDTDVTLVDREGGEETQEFTIHEGFPEEHVRPMDSQTGIRAGKPVSVFPFVLDPEEPPQPDNYVRFLSAMPEFLTPTVLTPDYRGYLIEMLPLDGMDPVFINGRPGETLTIPFQVKNLGRWDAEVLPDTIQLSVRATPQNWGGTAFFTEPELHIDHDRGVTGRLLVNLPEDMEANTGFSLVVEARSEGNPNMSDRFSVVVFSRQVFDVEAWFGEPSSQSGPESLSRRVLPDETIDLPIVVRNAGTGTDSFQPVIPPPEGGWEARLVGLDGRPVQQIGPLEPGQQHNLLLRLRAPMAEDFALLSFPIDFESQSSPTAVARLIVHARLSLGEGLELNAQDFVKSIIPGGSARFLVEAVNTGNEGVTMRFSLAGTLPEGWNVEFEGLGDPRSGDLSLSPGSHATIPLRLTAPLDAAARDLVSFLLRAESMEEGSEARDTIGLSGLVTQLHEIRVSTEDDRTVRPGQSYTIPVDIGNTGNGLEEVHLEPVQIPVGWELEFPDDPSILQPGNSTTTELGVKVSEGFPVGEVTLRFHARAGGGHVEPFNVTLNVEPVHAVILDDWEEHRALPGEQIVRMMRVENQGNLDETLRIRVDGPSGWFASIEPEQLDLPRGAQREFILTVSVPMEARGDAEFAVRIQDSGGGAQELALPVHVVVPNVELEDITYSGIARRAGSISHAILTLHNPSTLPAIGVEARLMAGSDLVDKVRFESIGPNGTVVAPLQWVVGEHSIPDRIMWGQEEEDRFQVHGERPFEPPGVSEEKGLPEPPVVLVLLTFVFLFSVMRWGTKGRSDL